MSVSWGTQYAKLKTHLGLAVSRLRLLQKKKTEQALKARTEIATFLSTDKEDRARIRVESIIREDFVVEAYELLEMYCELLLARFGLIQQMKELDDGIAEAVASILWVAPRISHEIAEFKVINDQLQQKYGKQYAEAARMNQLPEPSRVSPKLIQKLSVSAPSKLLVEKYLIEIARSANVPFTPDEKVMRDDDDEIANAERNLINFMNEEQQQQIGWNAAHLPPAVTGTPKGGYGGGSSGGGGGGVGVSLPFSYPPPKYPDTKPPSPPLSSSSVGGGMYPKANQQPPPPSISYPYPGGEEKKPTIGSDSTPTSFSTPSPTNYSSASASGYHGGPLPQPPPSTNTDISRGGALSEKDDEHIYELPPNIDDVFLKFPEPPTGLPNGGHSESHYLQPKTSSNKPTGGEDLDFDELAKRFEELKKKL